MLKEIEQALQAVNDSVFHRLCDAYLTLRGYKGITSSGIATGKDKPSSGTPDSYIRKENGNFIFIQYTTQQSGVAEKVKDDLEKCMDVSRTGVPTEKIDKILYCYNSKLKPDQIFDASRPFDESNIRLEFYDIASLSLGIYTEFPEIAKDFLGIQLTTGQILDLMAFVGVYQKHNTSTPLDNEFVHREKELEDISKALGENNLVILSGKPGVGKTKLALESSKQFISQNSEFKALYLFSRGVPLFEDIPRYLRENSHYLLVIDDANRFTSSLSFIIDAIIEQNPTKKIKAILTVRDYAIDAINKYTCQVKTKANVFISELGRSELVKMLETVSFNIHDRHIQERIIHLAQGNPRLAIMAAKVIKEKGEYQGLTTTASLYEEYFSGIMSEVEGLNSNEALKVLGIVAFFGSMTRGDQAQSGLLKETFGITESDFWDMLVRLYDLEIVDIYDNQIVKISDQIFSNFSFYRCFVKDKILPIQTLFEKYWEVHAGGFRENIVPILNTYGFEVTVKSIQAAVKSKFESLKENLEAVLPFLDQFWFVDQTNTLLFIKKELNKIVNPAPEFQELNLEDKSESSSEISLFKLLMEFEHSDEDHFKIAVELALDFYLKVSGEAKRAANFLTEGMSFGRSDHRHGYSRQQTLTDALLTRIRRPESEAAMEELFLKAANVFLKLEFSDTSSYQMEVTFHRFGLLDCDNLRYIRSVFWNFLKTGYSKPRLKKRIRKIFRDYIWETRRHYHKEICLFDCDFVLEIIREEFERSSVLDSYLANEYIDAFSTSNPEMDLLSLKSEFQSERFELFHLIGSQWHPGQYSPTEYEDNKRQNLKTFLDNKPNWTLTEVFDLLTEIKTADFLDNSHSFDRGIEFVFQNWVSTSLTTGLQATRMLLSTENFLGIRPYSLLEEFWKNPGFDYSEFRKSLLEIDFKYKSDWILMLYALTPQEKISPEIGLELLEYLSLIETTSYLFPFHLFQKFNGVIEKFTSKACEVLRERVENKSVDFGFDQLFNFAYSKWNLVEYLHGDVALLEKIYLTETNRREGSDHDAAVLRQILSVDPEFLFTLLEYKCGDKDYLRRNDLNIDLSFLWSRPDYEVLIERCLLKLAEFSAHHWYDFPDVFFSNKGKEEIRVRQLEFISTYVDKFNADSTKMAIIFGVIARRFKIERVDLIMRYLGFNPSPSNFEAALIDNEIYSGTGGSFVPEYEKRKLFFTTLFLKINDVNLLEHKSLVKDKMEDYDGMIQNESSRNFRRRRPWE